MEARQGKVAFADRQLTETDRNGHLARPVAGLANWATKRGNTVTRPLLETIAGIHRDAELPKYTGKTFVMRAKDNPPEIDTQAPAHGRKAVIFATCLRQLQHPGNRRCDTGGTSQERGSHRGRLSRLLRHVRNSNRVTWRVLPKRPRAPPWCWRPISSGATTWSCRCPHAP